MTDYAVPLRDALQLPVQPDVNKLRPRQKAILEFVYTYTEKRGYPPSLRDIGDAVAISSTSVINYNIKQLVEWHFLEQTEGKSRSILLTSAGYHVLDQSTPQEIQGERLRLVLENRRLRERCQQLEIRCNDLLRRGAS